MNDTDYPHEISLNAGINRFLGGLYSIEYARFYPQKIGFRTGVTYFDTENTDFNVSIPLYFSVRTELYESSAHFDEGLPDWFVFFFLLPNRFEFDAGLRPGMTRMTLSEDAPLGSIKNRFSYSMHAGVRLVYSFGQVGIALIPAYDYHFISGIYAYNKVYKSAFTLSGALTFRLKK